MPELNSRPKLSKKVKNLVAQWLLQHSNDGKLLHGAKQEAAEKFHVSLRTIWRIWQAVIAQQALGVPVNLQSKRIGQHYKVQPKFDEEKLKNLPVLQRTSLRVMAGNLGVSKSLCFNWVKKKQLIAHTSAIKPALTHQNKLCRLSWSLSQLQTHSEAGFIKFQTMFNTIHIDEKWFYLSKDKGRYYLVPGEVEPHRTCKSKRYIPKIMFECAVSRPIIDSAGNVLFDGKFGIFPFIKKEPAKRSSKNRDKGTMEVKPIDSITKEITKDCLLNQMVPVFKAKWLAFLSKHIFIQQDNAKPHIKPNDPDFLAIANTDGFHIQLVCQPPNSPDTNVNDLGFFRAIQTLKDQKPAKNVEDLLQNVKDAYEDFPPDKLNHVFLTLQGCYREIMKVKGDNNYKIPHMYKEGMEREGMLPECIEVEEELVMECLEFLNSQGSEEEHAFDFYQLEDLVQGMGHMRINH